jgi:hypothetical protein
MHHCGTHGMKKKERHKLNMKCHQSHGTQMKKKHHQIPEIYLENICGHTKVYVLSSHMCLLQLMLL